ncbi:M61 family peptidase [Stygiolobus caldivivus]|uniref:Peptidase M61 n=1 Tax=Stygiolobus caldivivus TaxID=2824673 RepID=A0A8D5U7G0_9CREN|nr:M61 family peptidase [Stygiolobus caldivivus]BCU70460.1 peptidase M61 [Stygiolobus caldivivus]
MYFEVEPRNRYIYVKGKGTVGREITFPTWVPGSYFVREQERNVTFLKGAIFTAKNRYYLTDEEFEYFYSAISKDQREAISTSEYLFINPVSVFPFQEVDEQYCVKLKLPSNWVVHTTLQKVGEAYCGDNYHEFADSPIQASPNLKLIKITESHYISTLHQLEDVEKLGKILLFLDQIYQENKTKNNSRKDYIFFFRRSDVSYGGIEHSHSSAIVVQWDRKDLFWLFTHEYIHRWNIKTLKPKEFLSFSYERENYTDLLWVAEGLTDYMAFLSTVAVGVTDTQQALKSIANILSNLTYPGIRRMSLAESSRLTWIKLYRRDENFLNVGVSYYDLGFIVGLIMDMKIRDESENTKDFFTFFKSLYKKCRDNGYTYADVKEIAAEFGVDFLDDLVYKRDPPIFSYLSDYVDIEFVDKGKPYLGIRLDGSKIVFVEDGSPADIAGLFPSDEVLAVNGIRGSSISPDLEKIELTVNREGVIKDFEIYTKPNPGHTIKLITKGGFFEKVFGKGEGVSDRKII